MVTHEGDEVRVYEQLILDDSEQHELILDDSEQLDTVCTEAPCVTACTEALCMGAAASAGQVGKTVTATAAAAPATQPAAPQHSANRCRSQAKSVTGWVTPVARADLCTLLSVTDWEPLWAASYKHWLLSRTVRKALLDAGAAWAFGSS